MKVFRILITVTGIIIFSIGCAGPSTQKNPDLTDNTPIDIDFKITNVLPHDSTSYTEGLFFHNGKLFESTGHTNSFPASRSVFGIVDRRTGSIEKKAEIDYHKYFGEGVIFLKDKFYQITDTTHIGFVYDGKTFEKEDSFHYDGEGWGLTADGASLMMSNGSSNIYYRDPADFRIIKILAVHDNNGPVQNLNELELIHGFLYSNQWLTNYVLKIDTSSGRVVGRMDLSDLKREAKQKYPSSEETNGIAFDSVSNKIYVTGKLWPSIYEIQFQ
jgi:glutamine cyclotransferase